MRIAIALILAAALHAQTSKAAGHWEGKIEIPEHEFSITVDLSPAPKGAEWIGSMSVIGSTSIDVPLAALSVDGYSVKFTANLPARATFEGKLSADGKSIAGTATNPQGDAPFNLARSGEPKVAVAPPSSPLTKEFEGLWNGSLSAGGREMHLGIRLTRAADGTAVGTLISYDQNNAEIPASTVTLHDKQLIVVSRAISGGFHGTLNDTGEIAGEWSQGGMKMPLTFKRAAN